MGLGIRSNLIKPEPGHKPCSLHGYTHKFVMDKKTHRRKNPYFKTCQCEEVTFLTAIDERGRFIN